MHKPTHTNPEPTPPSRARRASGPGAVGAHSHKARKATPSSAAPRRRRNRKPIHWTPIVVRCIASVLLITLIVLALTSPKLMIRHLDIQGTRTVDPQEVGALAAVPGRQNIFRYFLAQHRALARRVIQGEPAVAAASVEIRLPETLVVRVTERAPYAFLQTNDGTHWLLDPEAVPYRRVSHASVTATPSELPLIAIKNSSANFVLGKPLTPDALASVNSAYLLLAALRQTPYPSLDAPRRLVVDSYGNVSLLLANGLNVKLGQPEGLPGKLAQVQATLDTDPSLEGRAQYLDFTSPRPAWMPRPPVALVKPTALARSDAP